MAGTDKTASARRGAAPAVVLVNPQLGENIGTAARAMANFGLNELRIVDPRDGWPNEKAARLPLRAPTGSSRTPRSIPTLQDALTDFHYVYATTARPRGMIKEVITPEQAGSDMRGADRRAARNLAMLFGRERWGLNNDEVSLADVIVTAPVNPAFASLNIAQAVLLVGYEWYKAPGVDPRPGDARTSRPRGTGPADARHPPRHQGGALWVLRASRERSSTRRASSRLPEKKPGMVRNIRNLFARAAADRAGSPLAARHGRLAYPRASAQKGKLAQK